MLKILKSVNRNFGLSCSKMKLNFDSSLKGMKELDRDKFKMELMLPTIKVRKVDIGRLKKILRSFTIDNLNKKYQNLDENDALYQSHKSIILDPDLFDFSKLETSVKEELIKLLKEDKVRLLRLNHSPKNKF